MKSLFKTIKIFVFILIINSILCDDLEPFTPTEMMSVEKFSGYILDPTGKYLIMAVKKWNPDTGKSYSHLRYKNIETSETKILTPKIEGQSDSSPQFSSAFPNYLFFQRSNSDIKPSIYYKNNSL